MPSSEAEAPASAVQVAVRVRPLSGKETSQACDACVRVEAQSVLLAEKQFAFDAAFPPETPQERVYDELVAPLVDQFFDGYNATVFAYGQTGSGKTYTMGKEFQGRAEEAERGIIPRVMAEVFRRIEATCKEKKFETNVSYLEILNEDIHDLLAGATSNSAPTPAPSSLSVRGDDERGITVAGLSEHSVGSVDEVGQLLRSGAQCRATAATNMNVQSSRSHAICTLTMQQQYRTDDTESSVMETRISKFHLVDLAGSERVSRTNAQGERFKEGININRGLLALGNVINALCDRSRSGSSTMHIPYRDSKLTRLLQDSLGGNSKTLMIACISPADMNYEETANTLRYASRARSIENKAVVNKEVSAESEVARLKQQLEILQLQLLQQSGSSVRIFSAASPLLEEGGGVLETRNLTQENQRLRDELHVALQARDKWKKVADQIEAKAQDTSVSNATGITTLPSTSACLAKDALQNALAAKQTIGGTVPQTAKGAVLHGSGTGEHKTKTQQPSRQEQLRKFQMQKLAALNEKQSSGPKRKVDDTASATKRRRTLQQQSGGGPGLRKPAGDGKRSSHASSASGLRQSGVTITAISQTLEEIKLLLKQTFDAHETICRAKNAIRLELEERKRLAQEVSRVEKAQSPADSQKLTKLRSELKVKSGHIRLLQQKLASVERNNLLPSGLFPTKASLCHQVIRLLLETSMESKEECSVLSASNAGQAAAEQAMAAELSVHKKTIQALTSELDAAKTELRVLRKQLTAMPLKKAPKKRKPRQSYEPMDVIFSSSEEEDDSEADSDYVEDERPRKVNSGRRRKGARTSASKLPGTAPGSGGDVMDEIDELLDASGGSACCACHGKCATKACACKAQKRSCGADCSCKPDKCLNSEEGHHSVRNGDASVAAPTRGLVNLADVCKPSDRFSEVSGVSASEPPVMNQSIDH